MTRALADRGHRVTLLTGPDNDVTAADLPGIELRVLPTLRKPIRPALDVRTLRALSRELRALQPDLVHTHLAKAGILGRWAARRALVPAIVVHTVHGPTFADALPAWRRITFRALERRAARQADAMIFVGEELRESYRRAGAAAPDSVVIRTPRSKEQLAFDPPSSEIREKLRLALTDGSPAELLLVSVGRLVPNKRQHDAVRALARLLDEGTDARLVLVGEALASGEGGYAVILHRLARRLGVADRVHLVGHRDDVLSVMHAADVVVHTSRWEGLPNVAVEAALAGTPLVAYEVCGIAEVASDSCGDVIVPNGDVAALQNAVRETAERRSERRSVGDTMRRRRARLVDAYNEKRMIEELVNLYARLGVHEP